VARLVAAGGTFVEMRQDSDTYANPDSLAVMQDPEGNEFCVQRGFRHRLGLTESSWTALFTLARRSRRCDP
jgi:hypothetical protein